MLPTVASIDDLRQARDYQRTHKILWMFPDTGRYHREQYPKHLAFFAAGSSFKERLFMAANRVGKTESGAYEATKHLTGEYPAWWTGKRFTDPTDGWACGTTNETTRDIVQRALLGPFDKIGTGMIPADRIVFTKRRTHGLQDSFESIGVRHISGGTSVLGLKTYEQGRKAFEGTAKHFIWCDEEPPLDCYTEMLYRTVTTRGIAWTTFTPLQGMSEMVKGFVEPEPEAEQYKWFIQAGWKDAPHIDEDEKRVLIATTPPYQLKARTEGEPTLGAGAIYPIAEAEITARTMTIPASWPRAYGLDVGWNRTAAIWGARDPGTGTIYLYSEHYSAEQAPAIHAMAIKGRGDWIPGVIDPACLQSSQFDGTKLMEKYRAAGLNLTTAENSVETGIREVWELLISGRLKVLASCENWFREFRKYHRVEDGSGKIAKKNDHLMDATRYFIVSGRRLMKTKPLPKTPVSTGYGGGDRGWMG